MPAAAQAQDPAQTINGSERLAWTQQAFDAEELRQYSYVLYVDGDPVTLAGAACGSPAGELSSARCRSPLPPMARGPHTLELATRLTVKGVVLESAKSAALRVLVDPSLPVEPPPAEEPADRPEPGGRLPAAELFASEPYDPAAPAALLGRMRPAGERADGPADPAAQAAPPDGRLPAAELVATGLDDPTALAALPDGRLLVAERRGWVRVVENGRLADPPAALLADAAAESAGGWSLAVAPDFAESRHVYLGYPAGDRSGAPVGRVVRFREVGGVFGEAAVILDDLPADEGAPQVKVGPDGALYVATSARDAREAGDLGSYAGKLLRFAPDGTTPTDNPLRASPVFSAGHQAIVGFDWEPTSRTLWSVETVREGVRLRRLDAGSAGSRPSAWEEPAAILPGCGTAPCAGGDSALRLDGIAAAGAAFHSGSTPAAWRGSLFLASPEDECLYRVASLDLPKTIPVVEKLFCGQFGPIVAVASADDGLYFATASRAGDTGIAGEGEQPRTAGAIYRVRTAEVRTTTPTATSTTTAASGGPKSTGRRRP